MLLRYIPSGEGVVVFNLAVRGGFMFMEEDMPWRKEGRDDADACEALLAVRYPELKSSMDALLSLDGDTMFQLHCKLNYVSRCLRCFVIGISKCFSSCLKSMFSCNLHTNSYVEDSSLNTQV